MTEGPPPAGPPPYGPPNPYGPPAGYGQVAGYGPPPVPPKKKSLRWLWVTIGSVLTFALLACGGLGYALVAKEQKASAERNERLDRLYPVKNEEIDALLAAYEKALEGRDLKAFLALSDPANKKLVAQQTSLFHNYAKIPFQESVFKPGSKTEFTPVGAGHSFSMTVLFLHRIGDYDTALLEQRFYWGVLQKEKGGPLTITSTDPPKDLRTGSPHYVAPWDKWRAIHVERTPHTLVIVDASLRAEAQRYAPIAERAATANAAAWRDAGGSDKIPKGYVIALVKGQKELGSMFRTTTEPITESGVSISLPPHRVYTDGEEPPEDLDVAGSRVVIDVKSTFFKPGQRGGPDEIFRHELAHSMVAGFAKQTGRDLETWVTEGFAEYLGHARQSWTKSDRAASGRSMLRKLNYDLPLPQTYLWGGNAEQVNYHYWLAHSAISYIAEKYGEPKVYAFVEAHYRGKTDGEAMRDVLGVSFAQFSDGWGDYVKSKTR
ncbi:hypothetical protein [Asanoa iriomotensis]|uniref:Peptidase MA superfamily protein n=1 Tax=Asanoa iriomotensis TaxID=234613 RepID=A0ABQ4CCV0_9ACTN|nr:hypothetical protein [Asanoa iriomotensis]GIF60588.1 hypothetical protein Air01nite_66830 [Asanoa iriomotensis]